MWLGVKVGECLSSLFYKYKSVPEKGKYKNPKVKICKRCEIVKSNNSIIQKSKSSNMQKM